MSLKITSLKDSNSDSAGRILSDPASCSNSTMCGRYVFTSPLEAIQQMFKLDQMTNLGLNYKVAPTQEMHEPTEEGQATQLPLGVKI